MGRHEISNLLNNDKNCYLISSDTQLFSREGSQHKKNMFMTKLIFNISIKSLPLISTSQRSIQSNICCWCFKISEGPCQEQTLAQNSSPQEGKCLITQNTFQFPLYTWRSCGRHMKSLLPSY